MLVADTCFAEAGFATTTTITIQRRAEPRVVAPPPPPRPQVEFFTRPELLDASVQTPVLSPEAWDFAQQVARFFSAADREHRTQRERLRALLSEGNIVQTTALVQQLLRLAEQSTSATSIDDCADLLSLLPSLAWFVLQPLPYITAENWYVLAQAVARAPLPAEKRIGLLDNIARHSEAPQASGLILEGFARALGFVGFYATSEGVRQAVRQRLNHLLESQETQVRAEATAQLEELAS